MAKKMKRFAGGGASEPITVVGSRNTNPFESSSFRPDFGGAAMRNWGATSIPNQRLSPVTMPAPVASSGSRFSPAVITQPQSTLGNLVGARNPTGYGVSGRFNFKDGGKVKKMAKGGSVSSASKRADGCATKGKTKGRFV